MPNNKFANVTILGILTFYSFYPPIVNPQTSSDIIFYHLLLLFEVTLFIFL